MDSRSRSPVVIIGAPRSGTNMLRDVLCSLPGLATWPCDEINYIWRHRNARHPSDEFTPDMATPRVKRYIRGRFDWVERRYGARTVVEKTCANSLRVPFVDEVVPEARYLFLRRNGIDCVSSALERWRASLEPMYLLRKARFIPLSDLPYYASRYLLNRLHRLVSAEGRLSAWGPRFDRMSELLKRLSLPEVCAVQWAHCVESAAEAFSEMPGDRWLEVAYEQFVREPEEELDRVVDFLGLDADRGQRVRAVSDVTAGSVGKGRAKLDDEVIEAVIPHMRETMVRYGYLRSDHERAAGTGG